MKNKPNEKFADQQFNSRSLLEAFNQVAEQVDDTEFAQELGARKGTEANSQDEQNASDAILETYAQALDSYRQGTIDQSEES